jgi:hypothetical protein
MERLDEIEMVSVELPAEEALDGVWHIASRMINHPRTVPADKVGVNETAMQDNMARLVIALLACPEVEGRLINHLDTYLYSNWGAPDTDLSRWFRHEKDLEALEGFVAALKKNTEACLRCSVPA